MPTTALLVEIVIVGIGFFLSVLPIAAFIFNVEPQMILQFYGGIPLLFQLVSSYAAGIVWNRICDQIFTVPDKRIEKAKFSSHEAYQKARIKVVLQSESMRDYIGNFRSLIRVSRALSVLLIVYVVATPAYLFKFDIFNGLEALKKMMIFLFILSLLLTSVYAWFKLERGYISAIYDAYSVILEEERNQKNKESDKATSNG